MIVRSMVHMHIEHDTYIQTVKTVVLCYFKSLQ